MEKNNYSTILFKSLVCISAWFYDKTHLRRKRLAYSELLTLITNVVPAKSSPNAISLLYVNSTLAPGDATKGKFARDGKSVVDNGEI